MHMTQFPPIRLPNYIESMSGCGMPLPRFLKRHCRRAELLPNRIGTILLGIMAASNKSVIMRAVAALMVIVLITYGKGSTAVIDGYLIPIFFLQFNTVHFGLVYSHARLLCWFYVFNIEVKQYMEGIPQ